MLEAVVAALLHLVTGNVDRQEANYLTEAVLTRQADGALTAVKETGVDSYPGVDAYLLLGMGFIESHYQPWAVSYAVDCVGEGKARHCGRKHAMVKNGERPEGAEPSYYCGVVQVGGYIPWKQCVYLIYNQKLNYLTAAKHLQEWLDSVDIPGTPGCASRKDDDRLNCALLGNGGGYPAIKLWDRLTPEQRVKSHYSVISYPDRCLKAASILRTFSQQVQSVSKL